MNKDVTNWSPFAESMGTRKLIEEEKGDRFSFFVTWPLVISLIALMYRKTNIAVISLILSNLVYLINRSKG